VGDGSPGNRAFHDPSAIRPSRAITIAAPDHTEASRVNPNDQMTAADRDAADGPALLLLPAMGVAARFYDPLAIELERVCGAAVIPLDLPGQGESPVQARSVDYGYREVVESLIPDAIRRATVRYPRRPLYLVGHSLGGQLAVVAAAQTARWLNGLVLIAAGTAHWRSWPKGTRWRAAAVVHAIRTAAWLLPWYPGRLLGFGGEQARRFMSDWSFNATTGRYRLAGSARTPGEIELALGAVRLPVLSIAVRGDAIAPNGAELELLAKLPRACVERQAIDGVPGDGPWRRHFSWVRAPGEAAAATAAWLERQQPWRHEAGERPVADRAAATA
jgi:predicted alpha/beta hydrolase